MIRVILSCAIASVLAGASLLAARCAIARSVGDAPTATASAMPDPDGIIFQFFPEWAERGRVGELPLNGQAGHGVAIAGDTLVIGVPLAGANQGGSVQILRRSGNDWAFETVISHPQAGARFGWSVDLSGDRLIVGAPDYDDAQGHVDVGRAFVFHRDGAQWDLVANLDHAAGAASGSRLGFSVAISGNVAIVGAPFTTIQGSEVGFASFHRWDGTAWQVLAGAVGSDEGEQLGNAVDIVDRRTLFVDLEDYAVIGSPGRDLPAVSAFAAGGASAWKISVAGVVAAWQSIPFPNPVTFNAFGSALAISSNRLAVGAPGRDLHGKVLTYEIAGGLWQLEQELAPVDGETFDRFGNSVALSGERLVVGADGDDIDTDGGAVADAGSVYFFHNLSGVWFRNDRKTLRTPNAGDRYGTAVAISGIRALAGGEYVNGGGGNETGIAVEYIVDSIFRDNFD